MTSKNLRILQLEIVEDRAKVDFNTDALAIIGELRMLHAELELWREMQALMASSRVGDP